MTLFYENSLLYADALLADIEDKQVFDHRSISNADLINARALMVRSTTQVNQQLLEKAKNLSFVATGTAGFNHLDTDYLNQRDIDWYAAAGCNAISVAEYVLSVLWRMADRLNWQLADKSIGIVGAGHVGTALATRCEVLGMRVLLCDPPLAEQGDRRNLVAMQQIMHCDVISLHVPLVMQGSYPTFHLFDHQRLQQLSAQQVLINASRGEVLDNRAALALFEQGKHVNLVLDVWESEPRILTDLIPHVALATPHIAGHSLEGKTRGTAMIVERFCQHFALKNNVTLDQILPETQPITLDTAQMCSPARALCLQAYDIAKDDQRFRQQAISVEGFNALRKNYPVRREYNSYQITTDNDMDYQVPLALGFRKG